METPDEIAAQEEQERLAAEARGDIFTPSEEKTEVKLESQDDPEILARIAGETTDEEPVPAADDKRGETIPRGRFNEVLEKNKALEAELAALKGAAKQSEPEKPAEPAIDPVEEAQKELKQLRSEHRKALADALLDTEDEAAQAKVDELEEKIEALRDNLAQAKVMKTIETQTTRQTAQEKLQSVIDKAYEDFPFLDPKSPDANAELNNDIIAYRNGLVSQGVPMHQAVQRAVDKFAPAYAKEKGITIPTAYPNKAAEVRQAREKAAREKAAAASVAQPAALLGKGEKETFTLDVSKLTGKDIEKLPEETKVRMRGDAL